MYLEFWGAARTVTGSMHLLEVGGKRILLDCGLYQGRKSFERNRDIPFDPKTIDAVVLSHAHLDHSGNLPTLVAQGFRGKIWTTTATRDLCAYMLLDAAKIQEEDTRYINRRRKREGKRLWEPLYTREDTVNALLQFACVEYQQTFEPVPGVEVHFRDAGHILGSSIVVLDLEEGGQRRRLLFSGDVGREGMAILRDPRTAEEVDTLIMESTYGSRDHEPQQKAGDILREMAESTYKNRSKLIIPAFALGRTQEIVYRFNRLWEEGQLPPIDVFVDSPLAVNVTDVFKLHPECYDEEMLNAMLEEADKDPLGFRHLRYLKSVDDSKRLNTSNEPAIIICSSGMCEGGRVLHHLKNHIEDRKTTVLFVGYQAPGTLGRKIVDGESRVEIYGKEYQVRASIRKIGRYSAHAGRSELLDWARRVHNDGKLHQVFLVHGEEDSAEALAGELRKEGIGEKVHVPARGERHKIA